MQDDQVNKVKLLSVFEKTLIFKQISHRERIFFFFSLLLKLLKIGEQQHLLE